MKALPVHKEYAVVFLALWHSIKKCAGFFFFKKSVRSEGNRKPRGSSHRVSNDENQAQMVWTKNIKSDAVTMVK